MLGIKDYMPKFFEDPAAFRAAHGAFLHSLVGQVVECGWSMWSAARDEWFPDGPVILLIGKRQMELAAYQLGFAVSCNQIDRSRPLAWYVDDGEDDGLSLCWKQSSPPPLAEAAGRVVDTVELIQCGTTIGGSDHWNICGIGLSLRGGYLAVYNTLDELGLSAARLEETACLRMEQL